MIDAGSGSLLAQATVAWLKDECTNAQGDAERALLSEAILALRPSSQGQVAGAIDVLTASLTSGSKPPRDPSRVRPGHGRGKHPRQIR